jgi:hypothetical protein
VRVYQVEVEYILNEFEVYQPLLDPIGLHLTARVTKEEAAVIT